MKKTLLVPALLASSFLLAQDYNYEVTPLVGYDIAEGNLNLKNHSIIGGEVQFNNLGMPVSPELSVLYSNADFDPSMGSTNIYRIALNGVYEYKKIAFLTPFTKAGLGYETMSEHLKNVTGNEDSPFIDAGIGAKMPITKNIALKLEAVYMLKNNDNRWDNNLAILAGINIAFGAHAQPVVESKPVVAVAPVVAQVAEPVKAPEPMPVVEEKPIAETTSSVAVAPVAVVDGDDDQDGVNNSVDKCPTTPKGAKVNSDGCQEIVNLHVNFETNSFKIAQSSEANVEAFAAFMKLNTEYTTEITGYTDNVGNAAKNVKLSQKRADAVKADLVAKGVEASRIKTAGMGQATPVASNKTAQGRSENRRIEAKLIK
jgi:OOP family OmpA-OmpF porin